MSRGVSVFIGVLAFASLVPQAKAEIISRSLTASPTQPTITNAGQSTVLPQAQPLIAQGTAADQLIQTKTCKGCDLSNANLSGLDLSNADLSGANLSNADLSNANLTGANLSDANLYLAKLGNTTLFEAKLQKSTWTGAKADQVNLSNADLTEANLSYATMTGANFTGANLSRANASDANLSGANFTQANLTQTTLKNADLSNTVFSQANLTNAVLINANLSSANLQDATLTGANLAGAQLVQANLPADVAAATSSDSAPSGSSDTTSPTQKDTFSPTPLELPPIRLFNLETANQLKSGELSFAIGARNYINQKKGGGFGRQVNTANIDYGISDRLQIGLSGNLFSDRLEKFVAGQQVKFKDLNGALQAKYQILKDDKFAISVIGSAEFLEIRTSTTAFLSGAPLTNVQGKTTFAGAIQAPLTYSLSDQFQLHLTPGVSFFSDSFQGKPFYGTFFNIGAGASWQPLKRLNVFADLQAPLGPGGNSIRASNATISKNVVWSGGIRFLVNPAAALDIYATNGFGSTPATHSLSFIPGGDQVAIAATLNFTPDIGQNYAPDFRGKARVSLTPRDKQLLFGGLTLETADTLEPRTLKVRGGIGAGKTLSIATGLTNDVQIEFLADEYDGPTGNGLKSGLLRLGAAAKIRFLDQVQGDPFSLTARATLEQTVSEANGYSEGGLIFQYRPIPQLALIFEPKAGVFGDDKRFGTGFGFNYQIWKGLQAIGEYTPVWVGDNKTGVWSAGLRYLDPKLGLGVDIYGSNAAGLNSIGTLIGRPDASIGFNVHWLFGGR